MGGEGISVVLHASMELNQLLIAVDSVEAMPGYLLLLMSIYSSW